MKGTCIVLKEKIPSVEALIDKIKFATVSLVSIFPYFQGLPRNFIMRKKKGDSIGGMIQNSHALTILSFTGLVGFCSVNKAELLASRMGPSEAMRLNNHSIMVEGDSLCHKLGVKSLQGSLVIWQMEEEEVLDLSKNLKASFAHVKQIANTGADSLEGVDHQRMHTSLVDFIFFFFW